MPANAPITVAAVRRINARASVSPASARLSRPAHAAPRSSRVLPRRRWQELPTGGLLQGQEWQELPPRRLLPGRRWQELPSIGLLQGQEWQELPPRRMLPG